MEPTVDVLDLSQDVGKQVGERLRLVESALANANDAILITEAWPFDEPGPKVLYANLAFTKVSGYTAAEIVGKTPRILQGPKTDRRQLDKIRAALSKWESVKVELLNYAKDGREFWVELNIAPVADETGYYTHWVSVQRDITERKRVEESLREKNDTLQSFYNSAAVMMGVVGSVNDTIIHISDNEATAKFLGTTPDAMQGRTARALGLSAVWIQAWSAACRASILTGEPVHFDYQHHLGAGSHAWLEASVNYIGVDGSGHPRLSYVLVDVTRKRKADKELKAAHAELEERVRARTAELKLVNARLQHDAFHDRLTGLPNRALFVDRLGRAVERCKRRAEASCAVLFLDFDRFKVVNDSLGHGIGDKLLVAIGQRLTGSVREVDTVARFGGDEFTVLLEEFADGYETEVAERFLKELEQPFQVAGREIYISASIGIVLPGASYSHPEDILRDADTAMYGAKSRRGGGYQVFDQVMHDQALGRLELETDLRGVLAREELQVYYQPIVTARDRRLVGFEALMRWQHPRFGLVQPSSFIPTAEETGLIIDLDRWVLHRACQQFRSWRSLLPVDSALTLNVNFSGQQFMHPDLPEKLSAIMKGTGFDIDDFGTGYSSLAYLQRFPVDVVKIDRSFIANMTERSESAELVNTISLMARALGMQVVAEGVETQAQLELLSDLNCRYVQGYLFAKPLNAEEATAFVAGAFANRGAAKVLTGV